MFKKLLSILKERYTNFVSNLKSFARNNVGLIISTIVWTGFLINEIHGSRLYIVMDALSLGWCLKTIKERWGEDDDDDDDEEEDDEEDSPDDGGLSKTVKDQVSKILAKF